MGEMRVDNSTSATPRHPVSDLFEQWNNGIYGIFLVATKRLYLRMCPSVGWMVRRMVTSFFFARSDACLIYGLVQKKSTKLLLVFDIDTVYIQFFIHFIFNFPSDK